MENEEVTWSLFVCLFVYICLVRFVFSLFYLLVFNSLNETRAHLICDTMQWTTVPEQTRSNHYHYFSECCIPFIILFTQQNNNRIVISATAFQCVYKAMKFIYEHLFFHENIATVCCVYTTTLLCQTLLDVLSTRQMLYIHQNRLSCHCFFSYSFSLQSIAWLVCIGCCCYCYCVYERANSQRRPWIA